MHRIIIAISIALTICTSAYSQDTIDFATANNKTLQYTNESKWDSVIYYGTLALKNNIDYFFLRQRIGIAYYSLKNYFKAIDHFEKALQFSSSDAATIKYLYYCYLFTNRENERRLLESGMNENIKKSIGLKSKKIIISSIYIEGGTVICDNFKRNENTDVNKEYKFYGEADLNNNINYLQAGLTHPVSKRITIYHGIQLIQMDKMKIMSAYNHTPGDKITEVSYDSTFYMMPPPAHYIYDTIYTIHQTYNKTNHTEKKSSTLKQLDYYISCNIHTKRGIDVVPFFHYLNVKYTSLFVNIQKILFNAVDSIILHTQVWLPDSGGPNIVDTVLISTNAHADTLYTYPFPKSKVTLSNFVAGLSFSKYFGRSKVTVFGSFSNLNNKKQIEAGAGIIYFPKGNMNLYTGGTFTFLYEKNQNRAVCHVLAGFKILKKMWIEGSSTLGRVLNFTENNGYFVYNNPDAIIFSAGLKPIFVFNRFDISLNYRYLIKEAQYITYTSGSDYEYNKINYSGHSITGGVRWRF
ncbi:MAG: tetratricopeptide repeat protein [Bacteroidota bacterium]